MITGNTGFIADRLLLAGISLAAVLLHKKLQMTVYSAVIGLVPVTLHSLGWYHTYWLGIPFDLFLHFSAGFAISLILFDCLKGQCLSTWHSALFAIMATAGLGSFLEIFEYLGFSYGGEGTGIFFYGAGDFGEWANATKDMIANTLGATLSVALYTTLKKPRRVFICAVGILLLAVAGIAIHASVAYRGVDSFAPDDFSSTIEASGIPKDVLVAELRGLLDEPISYFEKGDIMLVLGRLGGDKKTACESVQYYERFLQDSYSQEMSALTHETLASLHCPESGLSRNDNLMKSAEIWKSLGNEGRYDLIMGIMHNNSRFYFREYVISKEPASKHIVGNSTLVLAANDYLITQVDRVTRDWLSGQLANVPGSDKLLRVFSEKYFLNEAELQAEIGWHEGARVSELKSTGLSHSTATGTIVKRFGRTWYAPDENGIYRFEVPEDKVLYPTTRYLRDDLAIIIDTHGVNMIVEQAIRKGATAVLGCCDHIGKNKAADYLAGKGIKVICFTDRLAYQLVGSENARNIIGSAPYVIEDGKAVFGNRPVNISGKSIVVSNSTDEIYALMYYDAPARYFKAIGADFTEVRLTDFGQMGQVTARARELNAKIIGIRVYDHDDYEAVRSWLDEDSTHKAVMLHSMPYPYGYRLFYEYPEQTSFADLQ
jgi:uncharacterized membrane protein YjdF